MQEKIILLRDRRVPIGEVDGVLSFLAYIKAPNESAARAQVIIEADSSSEDLRETLASAGRMETSAYRSTPAGLSIKPQDLVLCR